MEEATEDKGSKGITVRMPLSVLRRFTDLAEASGIKRNSLFVEALETYALLLEGGKLVIESPASKVKGGGR